MRSVLRARVGISALAIAFASACAKNPPPDEVKPAEKSPASAAAPGRHGGIQWTNAPEGTMDVASAVREAAARAQKDGRSLLVYVGATWCEPCQRFHHAVEQGELDSAFPSLSVLAFDTDRDGEALATAGYVSRLIPLFAVPNADGRASGRQIEGSVKGAAAVGEIAPRLRALLAGGS
ncbi:MAG TPA: thioredoxin family protein [Polyangiaceae bacterium]|jgi:thiol-disulfide isomerase/thioredoxin